MKENCETVPPVATWFQDGFHRFLKPYLRRHFHAIAVDRESCSGATLCSDGPLVVYGNHPSWWDPMVAHFLNRTLFAGRQFRAPIAAEALARYKVLGKLGFYGVQMDSKSGAARFLKQSNQILDSSDSAIWVTPEGRFADARDHREELMPGLAHLCARRSNGWVLPLALEYVFWDERLPVCLARMGAPIRIADHVGDSKPQWNDQLRQRLRDNQCRLAELAIARSSEPFDNLLVGKRGAGGIYEWMRRTKSVITRNEFRSQHGSQFE
ncbi:MAG: lysophospholipid acyltransferase family protein [Rubripirellula sp.]